MGANTQASLEGLLKEEIQMKRLLGLSVLCAVSAISICAFANGNPDTSFFTESEPEEKSWGVNYVYFDGASNEIFVIGDVFRLKDQTNKVLFKPGKTMKDRSWGNATITLDKKTDSNSGKVYLCNDNLNLKHHDALEKKHIFIMSRLGDSDTKLLIQFQPNESTAATCDEPQLEIHGGLAHAEN